MNKKFDEQLCKEFPLLYSCRNKSMQETCMCWGFDCGDGWYPIIYGLSCQLEPMIRKWIKDNPPPGLLRRAVSWVARKLHLWKFVVSWSYPCASQVKEKFGGLRFYMTSYTGDDMDNAISEAERVSYETCERCGNPGTQVGMYWIFTLCNECDAKRNKEKYNGNV